MWTPSIILFICVACAQNGQDPQQPDPEPQDSGSTPEEDRCGDGELDVDELCDEGEANGPEANCLPDCTLNPVQRHVVPVGQLVLFQRDAVGITDGGAPAGSGAWTVTLGDDNQDGIHKFELRVDPTWPTFQPALLDLKVSEIAEISFHTRKTNEGGAGDFYLVLYTTTDGVDDHADYFGYRLTGLPEHARHLAAPAGVWTRWSTAPGPNQLTLSDQPVSGSFGGAGMPTLEELQESQAFDWSQIVTGAPGTAIDYGAEKVKWIAIHSPSGGELDDFDSRVDLIRIDRTDGRALVLDLEP